MSTNIACSLVSVDAEDGRAGHGERLAAAEHAAVPEHEPVHEDGEGQRAQREVDAPKAQHGQGDEAADDAGDHGGERERQQPRGVGAELAHHHRPDADERHLHERHLAATAR